MVLIVSVVLVVVVMVVEVVGGGHDYYQTSYHTASIISFVCGEIYSPPIFGN